MEVKGGLGGDWQIVSNKILIVNLGILNKRIQSTKSQSSRASADG